MTAKPEGRRRSPEAELRSWIERLDPKTRKLARSVRTALRKRFPTANELAYDYKTFIVIAYSPTESGLDGIVSFAARPDGVRLYLMGGPQLPDPKGLLHGTGKQVRFVLVEAVRLLSHPDIKALIDAAIDRAKKPLPLVGRGRVIIRSAGANARPRRKPTK